MATVDGVVTAPDIYGNIQGNGGAVDKMAGGSGNDTLQGHAAFNQYYGGAGNDTFKIVAHFAVDSGAHVGASKAYADQFAYITDFQGAGVAGGDFVHLSGFDSNSLVATGAGAIGAQGQQVFYYSVTALTGEVFNFAVNSLTGSALGAGDFNFY